MSDTDAGGEPDVTRPQPRPRASDRRHVEGDRRKDHVPPHHARYEPRGILGEGGQGVVFRVFDRDLRRDVALKTLHPHTVSEESIARFLREVTSTAVLEHPNIVPIYDAGRLDDGRPFYTMRLVPGRSLASVFKELREAEQERRGDGEWSLVRLLQVMQQACLALEFAHERDIVHRDVKPTNVLLGEFGEVILVDWGISRRTSAVTQTATGIVQGTVQYMAPEQARGERVDARADVYAMGVLLYECLTLRLPHEGKSGADLIASILRDEPPPPQERTHREVPLELSELTLRALVKDRDQRLPSARILHEALQGYLEGLRDREKKLQAAERCRVEGETRLQRQESTEREIATLREEIARLEGIHPPWQPIPEKRELLDARRRLVDLEDRSRAEFLDAVHRLTESLAHAPEHVPSRTRLAAVFWSRFREAEERMDRPMAQVYRALVERFHDGRYARELDGKGSVRIEVFPKDAELTLHRLVEEDLVLVDGPGRPLGRGDVRIDEIEMGSYVLVARADGHEPARYPVAIFRNTQWEGELRLLPAGSIPEGYVYIPGTWAWLGGDPLATNSWPLRRVFVESFLMKRYPITFGEWCEFLDDVRGTPQWSDELVPCLETDGPLCQWDEATKRHVPFAGMDVSEEVERWGERVLRDAPVCGIHQPALDAYTSWLGARLGRPCSLPTAEQWELAARGVDRRIYPWGNWFDAALCHLRVSFAGRPTTGPVDGFPSDRSVYDVRAMAGCTQERTSTAVNALTKLVEARGGSWEAGPVVARSCWRGAAGARARTEYAGARIALQPLARRASQ